MPSFTARRFAGRVNRFVRLDPPASPRATRVPPLDAAARGRAATHTPLARRLAWRFAQCAARDVPADELLSEALYGLTYAAGHYDPGRGVPFPAYATLVIRHRLIQMVLRWRRNRVGALPIWTDADDVPWEAEDPRPGPDLCTGAAAREMCERVRNILPARWYAILRLCHVEGRSFQEVAARVGLSRQRVRQIARLAAARAREHFPEWTAS
ncbi:MAG TPA: sigma-70 family RNA polymerase sigma factor [Gemmataceae bacterium]|nr:sigma-70 family RNA polymerase sigma factor [Gemmataceae bacterium]